MDTSEQAGPSRGCPQHCPVTPGPPPFLPSLVVADRQAARAMTMESEDVRSPCAHAMVRRGPPGSGRGRLACPGTSASELPLPGATALGGNAKALCAHCSSQPHGQGGSSLPVTAHKPMGWVGSAASPPLRATRARCARSRRLESRAVPAVPQPCAPGESPQPHCALCPPSRPAAGDKVAALRGALRPAGVRCEGDGVSGASRGARGGKPLVTAPLFTARLVLLPL